MNRSDERGPSDLDLSDACGTLSGVVRYEIAALLRRFDVQVKGETELTGKLSSFLGERLLLSALTRYLRDVEGLEVRALRGRPARDDAEFPAHYKGPRYLDAWLLLDDRHLAAVECKHWTSSSTDYRSVPADSVARAAYAKEEMWDWLVSDVFVPRPRKWTGENKVALPLEQPKDMPSQDMTHVRRILAIWTPVSEDGYSCVSSFTTTTIKGGQWTDVVVEVFSASMYLRDLLAGGVSHLEAEDDELEKWLAALDGVVEVTGVSPAG